MSDSGRLTLPTGPELPYGARPACTDNPDDWFPEVGGTEYAALNAIRECRACEFRMECFAFAADPDNGVRHGIWGGIRFGRYSPDAKFVADYRRAVWNWPPDHTQHKETAA